MITASRLQGVLAALNLVCLAAFSGLSLSGSAGHHRESFVELDVERINIVGTNGRPVLILSNRARMPGPTLNGKEYSRDFSEGRSLLSGMIFLNEEGDEVGGLLFNGFKKGTAATDYGALGHLSFDQWKQNQVLALQYNDHGKTRRTGLTIWDRPTNVSLESEFDRAERMQHASGLQLEVLRRQAQEATANGSQGAQRLFVGSQDRVAQVELNDSQGRVRARFYVGTDDSPHLDFIDESGSIIASYPSKSN